MHTQLKKSDSNLYNRLLLNGVIKLHKTADIDKPKRTVSDTYNMGKLVSSGSSGEVYSGTTLKDGRPVAIKVIKTETVTKWKQYDGHMVPMEVCLHLQLGSVEGVLKMLDYYETADTFVLVFEKPLLCCDLFAYISNQQIIPEPLARHFMTQITDTLIQCQTVGVIHGDEDTVADLIWNKLKLIDFGSGSTNKAEKINHICGSRVVPPPEFITDGWYYGESMTVWSLGVLLFSMATGNIPFHTYEQILAGVLDFKTEVSQGCEHLIEWCLSPKISDRPTLEEIIEHPWMTVSE